MAKNYIKNTAAGEVYPQTGMNPRSPFEHQRDAMSALDRLDETHASYSTLVVLPTGGGKTYTASTWLLRNAIDRERKVLWLAHRQTLLEQAADSFQRYAYASELPHISSFHYRIISGAPSHDRTSDIQPFDDLLIISKDSLGRNLDRLNAWLDSEDELYLIIDEAHHSTAKTYRRIIDHVAARVPYVKMLGLTATPFRTAECEQGLLARIYKDGVADGQAVQGDIGIAYKIDLKELISRRILASPRFESYHTDEEYGTHLGLKAWESIQHLDQLPDEIAEEIAESGARNRLIVETYMQKAAEYGSTIVFAVNITHAITLTKLFNEAGKRRGIKAACIISETYDMGTGVKISHADNEKNLAAYRNGEVKILVNVNILTEGVDLPMTKSVFLARPTVSTILMTQMIGRGLRGKAAGGTSLTYIVSFIDDWNEHIAWVSPDSVFTGEGNVFDDDDKEYQKRLIRLISIAKIEEFAKILNDSIDTTALEAADFSERIPIGMYAFQYINEDGVDFSYQVMVYNSTQASYEALMQALPELFDVVDTEEEYLPEEVLDQLEARCRSRFFRTNMIPPYDARDIRHILEYYAQKESEPRFYTFDHVDRERLDVSAIARKIWTENMTRQAEAEYINELWEKGDDNLLRLFFGKKTYFIRMKDIEIAKLSEFPPERPAIAYEKKSCEQLPLYQIKEANPTLYEELHEEAFAKAEVEGGYQCASCGKIFKNRRYMQVDHIRPMNAGGLTTAGNLQILCRSCNALKADRWESDDT